MKSLLPSKLLGSDNHWCRIVMNRHSKQFVESLPFHELACLEISGARWERLGWKAYERLAYPAYDICEGPLEKAFDFISIEQVFEHLAEPERAARHVYTMLARGGHALISTPFLLRIHPEPIDCWRWTEDGLRRLLERAGFPRSCIETYSWGNRSCVRANLNRWMPYVPGLHSLKNEPDVPVVVWAVARKD